MTITLKQNNILIQVKRMKVKSESKLITYTHYLNKLVLVVVSELVGYFFRCS